MAGRDQSKQVHEKHQAILSKLLRDEDNKYCVDCDAKGPRWASWNLGVFLCIRCAGIHRNLGVHISKVKSINLDSWTPEQIAMMEDMGNSRARAVYEANLPDDYKRPHNSDQAMEQFIRAKYEHKKYIAREWVPPKPRSKPSHYNDLDSSSSSKKETKKAKPVITVPGAAAGTSASAKGKEKTTPSKPAAPQKEGPSLLADFGAPASAPANQQTAPPSSADLLADLFSSPGVTTNTQTTPAGGAGTDLFGLSSASPSNQTSTAAGPSAGDSGAQDLFQAANTKQKSAKDSIMALYGSQPSPSAGMGMMGQQQQNNMFTNGGMMGASYPAAGMQGGYQMPQQGMMGNHMMMGNPQQHGMMGNHMMMGGNPQQRGMMGNHMMMGGNPQQQGMMGNQGMMGGYYNPQQQQQAYAQQLQTQMANMSLNQQQMRPQQTPMTAGSWGTPAANGGQSNGQTLNFDLWN